MTEVDPGNTLELEMSGVPLTLWGRVVILGAMDRFQRDLQPLLEAVRQGDEGAPYRLRTFYADCSQVVGMAEEFGGIEPLDNFRNPMLGNESL